MKHAIPADPAPASLVDDLKRLERFGSENSRTIEKLKTAANGLGRRIVELFELEDTHAERAEIRLPAGSQNGILPNRAGRKYRITNGQLMACFDFADRPLSVGHDRHTAIVFAEDVANGFLQDVKIALEKDVARSAAAERNLSDAISALR